MKNKVPDLSNKRFYRWTVIKKDNTTTDSRGRNDFYICKCDCGTIRPVNKWRLLRGTSKSCGCYRKDYITAKDTKHGHSRERLYNIYYMIRSRCYDENHISFPNYGGRGIKMCDEWYNDVTSFLSWCYNNGYKENLTIDRIDVDRNYEPSNCRFVTNTEQQRNRRDNRKVFIRGKEYVLADACEIFNISFRNATQVYTTHRGDKEYMTKYFLDRI